LRDAYDERARVIQKATLNTGKDTVQSFGEQHLDVEDYSRCGTVRVLGIYSDSALYPRLGIRLGVTVREILPSGDMPALRQGGLTKYEVTIREGELRLDNGGPLVGLLRPTQADTEFRSSQYHSESHTALAVDLDLARIEAIEKYRAGRPASLSLIVWPTAVTREGKRLRIAMGPLLFEIPHDKWAQFLSDVKYGDYEIIEMKRPTIDGPAFAEVRAQLDLARQRIINGQYNSALAALRTGWDRFYEETRADGRPPIEQMLVAATDEVRGAAYVTIMKQAKEICHKAVHKPEASIPITRAEAVFVLRTAENCMALVGELVGG
jgi:hypothetical protein